MNKLFVLCYLLISSGLLFTIDAQILNIEKSRLESDSVNYFAGNVNMSGSLYNRSAAEGSPVNLLGLNLGSNMYYKGERHQYIFITQIDYLRINDSPFLNTGYFHLRAHLWTENRWSMEVYSQYQYDNFRQLNPRILFGATPRYSFINNDQVSFYGGSGLFYEAETWVHPFTDDIVQLNLLKSSSYLSFRGSFGENFNLNLVNYYQVGYDRNISEFRHRVNVLFNVLTNITKRLSFTFSFNIQYEDKPVVPVTPLIYDFRNGLTYRF